jgi:S1-C subfamily serine protease
MARAISRQLEKYGAVARGELGFTLSPLTPDLAKKWKVPAERSGALIAKVETHSAAERAGLKPGDLVAAIGGTPVQDVPDLRNRLAVLRVGDAVELTVLRTGHTMQLRAIIDEPAWKTLDGNQVAELLDGALFTSTSTGAIPKGVQVATVRGGSNAWASGLRDGDIVTAINNSRVIGLDQFVSEAGKLSGGMSLDIIRGGEQLFVTIRMTESKSETQVK